MDKQVLTISINKEVVSQTRAVQTGLVGSSNLSGLIEKLLIDWLQQFRRVE